VKGMQGIPEVRVLLTVAREDLQIAFAAREDEIKKAIELAFDEAMKNFDAVGAIQGQINSYVSEEVSAMARKLTDKYAKEILAGIKIEEVFNNKWVQEKVRQRIGEAGRWYGRYSKLPRKHTVTPTRL
jgi:hypothetical protein